MDEPIQKMEKDCAPIVDAQMPEIDAAAKGGDLTKALEQLLALEKQTRSAADLASSTRVLKRFIQLTFEAHDWKQMQEYIVLLSKKHGQLKHAITKMVQEAMECLDKTPDMKTKLELIDTLRTVTDGKVYLEVERARVTRILAKIKENEGNMAEAADIMQDLQVETFGSMEKREKTDFILEQMRLCLLKRDYIRANIISKKINIRYFKDADVQDLKLRFYDLMIEYSLHENEYLNACKHYRQIYDTPCIKEDPAKAKKAIENAVLFVILAPFDNEQSDLIQRVYLEAEEVETTVYRDLLKCFITAELMRWPMIEQIYGSTLRQNPVLSGSDEASRKRLKELHNRVVEHNIRVIAKYYTRITTKRLTQLLDLPDKDCEEFLSKLVVSKTIYAKIDRPAGIVSFAKTKHPNEVLNEWSQNINSLLGLIEKTCHLITKEEIIHSITKVI
ncbi:26S proteasome non-ATPase regulatory subunit 12 [Lobosporangium transversale]|uniref:PCI domain-domain-containing protein n=1 Tax=Lobosporangium transversale TaxID=64571 RepID=A0A1Y2GB68_9FUNG|nr:PCI domain-domain-containing protein [Lobosporangium transversale]KAF9912767.1 26S proteasome non-ATPase regulatory subunit 12 [Lobosporangium transversale]ORZ06108.1 PCI domain-domain-containing protein [Lobosporangium transversale]|eukprot:XP_021877377.1 PCI domain-domain-containing protein [Lobosporangium transversale]